MPKKVAIVQDIKPGLMTPEQVDLIKRTVARGATDDELALFLYTAKRTGLDPLTRQIHFVKRGAQATIQTGIDGYRAIASRTGQLAGISDAVYDSEDAVHPKKATVTVHRLVEGRKVPFKASARWSEYAPTGNQAFMWTKMPYLMLGKVAEALALRKAFPSDLSGLYTSEEMNQAETPKMEPYRVERVVAAEDDDEISEPVSIRSDDMEEAYEEARRQIKELMLDLGHKKPTPGTVQKVTGFPMTIENYSKILKKLQELSPIEQAINEE